MREDSVCLYLLFFIYISRVFLSSLISTSASKRRGVLENNKVLKSQHPWQWQMFPTHGRGSRCTAGVHSSSCVNPYLLHGRSLCSQANKIKQPVPRRQVTCTLDSWLTMTEAKSLSQEVQRITSPILLPILLILFFLQSPLIDFNTPLSI